ncbi:MAG: hypothetical protein H6832_08365 [Planctomycetes bacterium]|nr:hypothetical protein [Planctomycetota bacterium]MCB9918402.1 hypothetical protein [Planctomycetota bacterium]
MDYRQLPGDPGEAERFSWSNFLTPDGRAAPDVSTDLESPVARGASSAEEGASSPSRSHESRVPLRTSAGVVLLAIFVTTLTFTVPRLAPGLASVWSLVLPIGDGDSDFLDGEIPVDD